MRSITRIRFQQLLLVGVAVTWAGQAWGQAWVAPPNSLDLNFGYQYVDNNGHYGGGLEGSNELQAEDLDTSTSHSLQLGAEYSTPLQGLSVGLAITLVNTAFTGSSAYQPHGQHHTCVGMPPMQTCTHEDLGTKLTDGNLDLRYQLPFSPGGVAITPTAGVTVPLTDYPTIGHTAYGKHLNEYRAGIEVGKIFFDKLYVDALYTYSIVERVDQCVIAPPTSPIAGMCVPMTADIAKDMSLNRSDAKLVAGYFVLPQLSVFGAGLWRHVHGGFSWGDAQAIRAKIMAMQPLTPLEMTKMTFHDQLGRERMIMVGGGLNYQPVDQIGLQAGVYKVVKGDSVANSLAAGVGVSWTAF